MSIRSSAHALAVAVWLLITLAACQNASAPTVTPTTAPISTVTPNQQGTAAAATSSTASSISTVTANKQWTPQTQAFGNVDMVEAPPGCFKMGSDGSNDSEKPVTQVCFKAAFWIDKNLVTQAQFKQIGGNAAQKPGFTGDNRPVENITWFEARDFCLKRNARLPTEAEWEYAARGPDALVYPWGNDFDGSKVVSNTNTTADVGSKPAGASWVDALDMSGEVWEWTHSIYQAYPYDANDGRESETGNSARVRRGASWSASNADALRAALRNADNPGDANNDIGFRCAHS